MYEVHQQLSLKLKEVIFQNKNKHPEPEQQVRQLATGLVLGISNILILQWLLKLLEALVCLTKCRKMITKFFNRIMFH